MLRTYCLLMLLSVGFYNGQALDDFDTVDSALGFTFYYFKYDDLLLTIRFESCYFARVERNMHDKELQNFQYMEKLIETAISSDDESRKTGTTLDQVRNDFQSPMADYFCRGKDIYVISLDYVECDFEGQLTPCLWNINLQSRLKWRVNNGETPSQLTGPDTDHTKQSVLGQYIYMEANEGRLGDAAELVSPTLVVHQDQGMCLRFWYSMYGDDVESLQVIAQSLSSPATQNLTLWRRSGNQGDGWKLAEVTVPKGLAWTSSMTLRLVATRGSSNYGDIAVDDISSTPGVCPFSLLDCSFETSEALCKWKQSATDQMQWELRSGPTATSSTGPQAAPSVPGKNNSQYLYLEGDHGTPDDKADLLSARMLLQGPICLTFAYNMLGSGVGELDVLQTGLIRDISIWRRTGDQGSGWQSAKVTIDPLDARTPVQVIFRAIRGRSPASDIAIDLVSGLSGSCEQQLSSSAPVVG